MDESVQKVPDAEDAKYDNSELKRRQKQREKEAKKAEKVGRICTVLYLQQYTNGLDIHSPAGRGRSSCY